MRIGDCTSMTSIEEGVAIGVRSWETVVPSSSSELSSTIRRLHSRCRFVGLYRPSLPTYLAGDINLVSYLDQSIGSSSFSSELSADKNVLLCWRVRARFVGGFGGSPLPSKLNALVGRLVVGFSRSGFVTAILGSCSCRGRNVRREKQKCDDLVSRTWLMVCRWLTSLVY